MARRPEDLSPNNFHYSEQVGHQARGVVNKALAQAKKQNIPVSKGEFSFIARRFGMMRSPTPQGRR